MRRGTEGGKGGENQEEKRRRRGKDQRRRRTTPVWGEEGGKFVRQGEDRGERIEKFEEGIEAGSQGASTRTVDWVTEIIRMMIRSGTRLVDQFFLGPFLLGRCRSNCRSRDQFSFEVG